MSLAICVQHHPNRAHLLPALLARLEGAFVVTDPKANSPHRSPLRTYIACMEALPEGATHYLVIQDDAWPVPVFRPQAEACIAERPEDMIAFFTPGTGGHRRAILTAQNAGQRWARLRPSWIPTVALCWQARLVSGFVEHARKYDVERTRGDDMPVGRYLSSLRVPVWATVPSLVEHPDVEPSLIGRRAAAGRNRARVAAAAHKDLQTSD